MTSDHQLSTQTEMPHPLGKISTSKWVWKAQPEAGRVKVITRLGRTWPSFATSVVCALFGSVTDSIHRFVERECFANLSWAPPDYDRCVSIYTHNSSCIGKLCQPFSGDLPNGDIMVKCHICVAHGRFTNHFLHVQLIFIPVVTSPHGYEYE
ncbi:hypothetical protein TTRE_0000155401 [Trichuris trichiura]|uniref:Uncharacterized protein n=1 Tax=Trichuris trichiura TaxID=36087 RepID=A0A077Z3J2_TRITR|nr:hypothetical protein TTRE_0000155401 [Trichuris trichiura]